MNQEAIAAFLKQVLIFQDLDDEPLETLAGSAQQKSYSKGSIICERREMARYLHIICSGQVTEMVVDDNELTCIARPNQKGNYFGELGLLLNEPYPTTSVAGTDVRLLRIPKEVFCEVAWSQHCVIQSVLRVLTHRLQKSGEKTISFVNFNAKGRLAYNLFQMRNEKNEILTTQESLSEQCGIVRQTVSSILNSWKQMGVIDLKRGKIIVLEPNRLVNFFMSDQNIR